MNDPIHPLQVLFDGIGAAMQKKRANTQSTLGGLIKMLEILEVSYPGRKITGLGRPMSYRGYYCDLAFEPNLLEVPISEALKVVKSCMGNVFEGYKGGDFQMGENTPLWSACYGDTGMRIMGLNSEKDVTTLILAPDKD